MSSIKSFCALLCASAVPLAALAQNLETSSVFPAAGLLPLAEDEAAGAASVNTGAIVIDEAYIDAVTATPIDNVSVDGESKTVTWSACPESFTDVTVAEGCTLVLAFDAVANWPEAYIRTTEQKSGGNPGEVTGEGSSARLIFRPTGAMTIGDSFVNKAFANGSSDQGNRFCGTIVLGHGVTWDMSGERGGKVGYLAGLSIEDGATLKLSGGTSGNESYPRDSFGSCDVSVAGSGADGNGAIWFSAADGGFFWGNVTLVGDTTVKVDQAMAANALKDATWSCNGYALSVIGSLPLDFGSSATLDASSGSLKAPLSLNGRVAGEVVTLSGEGSVTGDIAFAGDVTLASGARIELPVTAADAPVWDIPGTLTVPEDASLTLALPADTDVTAPAVLLSAASVVGQAGLQGPEGARLLNLGGTALVLAADDVLCAVASGETAWADLTWTRADGTEAEIAGDSAVLLTLEDGSSLDIAGAQTVASLNLAGASAAVAATLSGDGLSVSEALRVIRGNVTLPVGLAFDQTTSGDSDADGAPGDNPAFEIAEGASVTLSGSGKYIRKESVVGGGTLIKPIGIDRIGFYGAGQHSLDGITLRLLGGGVKFSLGTDDPSMNNATVIFGDGTARTDAALCQYGWLRLSGEVTFDAQSAMSHTTNSNARVAPISGTATRLTLTGPSAKRIALGESLAVTLRQGETTVTLAGNGNAVTVEPDAVAKIDGPGFAASGIFTGTGAVELTGTGTVQVNALADSFGGTLRVAEGSELTLPAAMLFASDASGTKPLLEIPAGTAVTVNGNGGTLVQRNAVRGLGEGAVLKVTDSVGYNLRSAGTDNVPILENVRLEVPKITASHDGDPWLKDATVVFTGSESSSTWTAANWVKADGTVTVEVPEGRTVTFDTARAFRREGEPKLVKTGAGTFAVKVQNIPIEVREGRLELTWDGANRPATTVAAGATFAMASADTMSLGNITGNGTIEITGSTAVSGFGMEAGKFNGTLRVTEGVTKSGDWTIPCNVELQGSCSAALTVSSGYTLSGSGTVAGTLTLQDGATLDATAGALTVGDLALSGSVSLDSAGLTAGAQVLTLSAGEASDAVAAKFTLIGADGLVVSASGSAYVLAEPAGDLNLSDVTVGGDGSAEVSLKGNTLTVDAVPEGLTTLTLSGTGFVVLGEGLTGALPAIRLADSAAVTAPAALIFVSAADADGVADVEVPATPGVTLGTDAVLTVGFEAGTTMKRAGTVAGPGTLSLALGEGTAIARFIGQDAPVLSGVTVSVASGVTLEGRSAAEGNLVMAGSVTLDVAAGADVRCIDPVSGTAGSPLSLVTAGDGSVAVPIGSGWYGFNNGAASMTVTAMSAESGGFMPLTQIAGSGALTVIYPENAETGFGAHSVAMYTGPVTLINRSGKPRVMWASGAGSEDSAWSGFYIPSLTVMGDIVWQGGVRADGFRKCYLYVKDRIAGGEIGGSLTLEGVLLCANAAVSSEEKAATTLDIPVLVGTNGQFDYAGGACVWELTANGNVKVGAGGQMMLLGSIAGEGAVAIAPDGSLVANGASSGEFGVKLTLHGGAVIDIRNSPDTGKIAGIDNASPITAVGVSAETPVSIRLPAGITEDTLIIDATGLSADGFVTDAEGFYLAVADDDGDGTPSLLLRAEPALPTPVPGTGGSYDTVDPDLLLPLRQTAFEAGITGTFVIRRADDGAVLDADTLGAVLGCFVGVQATARPGTDGAEDAVELDYGFGVADIVLGADGGLTLGAAVTGAAFADGNVYELVRVDLGGTDAEEKITLTPVLSEDKTAVTLVPADGAALTPTDGTLLFRIRVSRPEAGAAAAEAVVE